MAVWIYSKSDSRTRWLAPLALIVLATVGGVAADCDLTEWWNDPCDVSTTPPMPNIRHSRSAETALANAFQMHHNYYKQEFKRMKKFFKFGKLMHIDGTCHETKGMGERMKHEPLKAFIDYLECFSVSLYNLNEMEISSNAGSLPEDKRCKHVRTLADKMKLLLCEAVTEYVDVQNTTYEIYKEKKGELQRFATKVPERAMLTDGLMQYHSYLKDYKKFLNVSKRLLFKPKKKNKKAKSSKAKSSMGKKRSDKKKKT